MISAVVLGRYARSLADVALESNEVEGVTGDLELYGEVFRAVPALLDAFHSPAVPREVKEKVLAELISRYPVQRITGNFLRVLLQHNRIRYFHEICGSFAKIVDARRGIVTARVTAAAALSKAESAELRECLSKATGKSINLDVHVEPAILGGVVVQVESTVYDGSIRKQLAEMRRYLAEGGQE